MKNKLLLSSALVGTLVGGSAAVAQTTITGSLDLTYTNVTARTVAGNVGGSYRGLGRESQLNVQNKGKLNNGIDYAAGFALEFDGNSNYSDTNTAATTEASTISNENVSSPITEEKIDSKLLEGDKGWDSYSNFEKQNNVLQKGPTLFY